MAINISNNYSNSQVSLMQKFHSVYQKNVEEKVSKPQNNINEDSQLRDISSKDIREYLSVDEKRVLKEVFGDLNVDKNSSSPYSHSKYMDFFKGSQIDIKL